MLCVGAMILIAWVCRATLSAGLPSDLVLWDVGNVKARLAHATFLLPSPDEPLSPRLTQFVCLVPSCKWGTFDASTRFF